MKRRQYSKLIYQVMMIPPQEPMNRAQNRALRRFIRESRTMKLLKRMRRHQHEKTTVQKTKEAD